MPLEITVDDARALTVKRERSKLHRVRLQKDPLPTAEASPTGTWNINVHVVRTTAPGLLGFDFGAGAGVPAGPPEMTARLTSDKPGEGHYAGRLGDARWTQGAD